MPVVLEIAESTLDGVIAVNTFATKIQEVATEIVLNKKVSEFEKEIAQVFSTKPRYMKIFDAVKDEKLKDAVGLLAMMKGIVNESIDKKFAATPLKEFLQNKKESGILIP